jgi:uncharacterized protein YyaL (SSP411 family)
VVEETLDFVVREMRHEAGGFYSSYDADSEGEEGKFYVWSADEIRAALGAEADLFMAYYDVSAGGNWEGHNILNAPRELDEVAAQFNPPRPKWNGGWPRGGVFSMKCAPGASGPVWMTRY